jgi:glycosyltransferase involved in cell wall biosynthesis
MPHYPWWKKQRDVNDSLFLDGRKNLHLVRRNHTVPSKQSNTRRFLMEVTFGFSVVFSWKIKAPRVVLVSPAMVSSAIVLAWIRVFHRKTKVLVWVHDLYEQGLKETGSKVGPAALLISKIENWLLSQVNRVIFAHEPFEGAKGYIDRSKINSASIPIWSQFNYLSTDTNSVTREKFLLGNKKVILHIGNMGVKQGLESVVQAAFEAERQNSEILFVLVGAGNQIESLKTLAGTCKHIIFIDPVSETELSNLMNAADLLLVNEKPGVREMSMPSKLTTYFQTGKIVVACTEKDSIAGKTIIENELGVWVQSGDPAELLKTINLIDIQQMNYLAENAKRYAEVNFSKKAALASFVESINNL